MKRKLLISFLGIAASATALGQGGIFFSNSLPDAGGNYHPVQFAAEGWLGPPSESGVVLSFWYGKGAGLSPDQLIKGPDAAWSVALEAAGYYGYYDPTTVVLSDWMPGDTYTFQLVASLPGYMSLKSGTWEENANITFIGGSPPQPPGFSDNRPTIVVPEPSAIALIGLGMAALVTLHRGSRFMGGSWE